MAGLDPKLEGVGFRDRSDARATSDDGSHRSAATVL